VRKTNGYFLLRKHITVPKIPKTILQDTTRFIEENIEEGFHNKKLDKISKLSLEDILKRKNPYLFKAKYTNTAHDFIKAVFDATISSGEETQFGNFLERVAIHVCEVAKNGRKSGSKGIDLEFEEKKTKYLISIKSGPNWGNSGQIEKMIQNFNSAKKTLSTSGGAKGTNFVFIEGCCYGIDNSPDKGTHLKLCGESFWELVSWGDSSLYKKIIVPLGYKAKEKNDELNKIYSSKMNLFEKDFLNRFCDASGNISWDKLIKYNSGK
jgi:hypothetical protein